MRERGVESKNIVAQGETATMLESKNLGSHLSSDSYYLCDLVEIPQLNFLICKMRTIVNHNLFHRISVSKLLYVCVNYVLSFLLDCIPGIVLNFKDHVAPCCLMNSFFSLAYIFYFIF